MIAYNLFFSSSTGVSPSLGWNDSFDSKAVLTWCIIHPSCWWSWTRLCCWSKRKDFDSGPSWMDCTPALFKVRLVNIGQRCIHVWGFKTSLQLPATARNCQSSTGFLITCCQLLWLKLITFWPLTNFTKTPTFAELDAYFKTFWNPCMYMYGWYVKFTYNCTVVMLWVNNLKNVGFVMIGSVFYYLDSRYILP